MTLEEAKKIVNKQLAIEREQMRMAEQSKKLENSWKSYVLETERKQEQLKREQEKRERDFLREQQRQAKELEKHEAWLRKHDEEIEKLKFRLSEAERTLAHYGPMLESLKKEAQDLDTRIWWYEKNGLPCAGIKEKYFKLSEKVFSLEGKVLKAQFEKEQAAKKISAA